MDARSILDTALDAVVLSDGQGSIVWLNRAAERIFGYARSEAVGQEVAELLVPERLREADREGIARVASGGPPHILGEPVEFPALRADGSEFPVELTVTRSEDEPVRFTAWIRELAPRGEPGEDGNHLRLRTLMERAEASGGLGTWDWDVPGDELVWSDNLFRLFGLEPGALDPTAEYVFERTHPDDRARVERQVRALTKTGELSPLEYRIIREDGSLAYLVATLAVVDAAGGDVKRLVGSVQDITALRRAERELTAHFAVSVALSEWRSFDQSAATLLRGLAEALEYEAAALWVPDGERLGRRALWSVDGVDRDRLTRMLPRERPAGAGLAGLVRRERTPVAEGRVIGVPVMTGVELLGVIELHAPTEMPVSELMMDTLTGIGYEVGQFLSHRRGELEPHGLTARELEVLQLAARGNSGPEIAARLFVSPATVKTHFENIYAKLHVSDRAAAVAYALRMGLID